MTMYSTLSPLLQGAGSKKRESAARGYRAGWFVVSIGLAAIGSMLWVENASARTLLDWLFGPRIYRENTDRLIDDGRRGRPKNRPVKRARPRPETVRTSPTPGPREEPGIPVKLPDAKAVLVVGDFMAGSLAEGLDAAFLDAPGVRVVDKADGSSGFVRNDHRDWPASIADMIAKEKPAVVVIMIGANDRQQFSDGGALLGDEWTREYQTRMNAFLDAVKKTGHPVVWVGQPAFKSKSITNDVLAFNELYRNATEKAQGTFVDVWDGFVDQSGNFTLSGFDVSGQTARLRNNDGIGMTAAGKRKLAFYVEKPLRQMLGNATSPDIAAIKPGAPVQALPDARAPVRVDRLAPVSLNDPELDGGTALLGATPRGAPAGEKSARDRLIIDGVAPEGQPGRVNDFSWPPQP